MQGLNLITWNGLRAVVIRTTDRITFKQCRRKWNWASHLKQNLGPLHLPGPLWFGSAIHYALEDFHGYNAFGHPRTAFQAYCVATAHNWKRELPPDAQDLWHLGNGMMDYYHDRWLPYKTNDRTYWEDGIPQVEVNFEIPVYPHECNEIIQRHCAAHGIEVILYRGTFDKISIDEHGRLWVVEYKTAKRAEHLHYQTDPQITTYVWAASHVYNRPVAGVVYVQFVKTEAQKPRTLMNGRISTAKNQVTSGTLYKAALENMYGEVRKAPKENGDFLAFLYSTETQNRDRYIQRVEVDRNAIQAETEAQTILIELEDMLNPELPLYKNPTRDCSRMCSFLSTCVSFDDGSDWEYELKQIFGSRDDAGERYWRMRLPPPAELLKAHQQGIEPDLEGLQINAKAYKLAEMESGEVAYDESEVPTSYPDTYNLQDA